MRAVRWSSILACAGLGACAAALLILLLALPAQVVHGDIEANNVMAAHHFYHGEMPRGGPADRGGYHPLYPMLLSCAFGIERHGMPAVFRAGLVLNWLVWMAALGLVWRTYAAAMRHAASLVLLIALWSASWSYATVLYSETLFMAWLIVIWAWHKYGARRDRWWALCGLGVWSGFGYAVRPAGVIVWLALTIVMTVQTRSLRRVLYVAGGGVVGMAAAIALVSAARGEGVHVTTYMFPREVRGCDATRYAARATLAFVRNIQSGIVESYGLIVLAPLCLLRTPERTVAWEAVLWYGAWLLASVCASLMVACYPVYQPAFIVTRYTTPFVVLTAIACAPVLAKLDIPRSWGMICIILVAVAAWCMPWHDARLIDNLSVAWWRCGMTQWSAMMAVIPAGLAWLCRRHVSMPRMCALHGSILVIAVANAAVLWNSSVRNQQHLDALRRNLPERLALGATYAPVLGNRDKVDVFDYATLQLWNPAVYIVPPRPWSPQRMPVCGMERCRLMGPTRGRRER